MEVQLQLDYIMHAIIGLPKRTCVRGKKVKSKVTPTLPSIGPGADPGVQAVSPQVTFGSPRR